MTLAPDRIGYHRPGEVDDAETVDIVPVLGDPTRPPDNAPSIHELDRAANVILWHLAEGYDAQTDDRVTHAHVVTDLNRWINPAGFRCLAADYENLPMDGHHCPADHAEAFLAELTTYLIGQGYDNRKDQP